MLFNVVLYVGLTAATNAGVKAWENCQSTSECPEAYVCCVGPEDTLQMKHTCRIGPHACSSATTTVNEFASYPTQTSMTEIPGETTGTQEDPTSSAFSLRKSVFFVVLSLI